MRTLKQLADKISKEYSLNISKQAIQYHGDKLEVEYHYINGIKHLDEGQQKLITDRIKSVHQINVDTSNESSNDNVEDKEDNNKNAQSNNSNDYESVIEQYEARIKDLKEAHEKHIKDLNKQLDKKQETINNLTVSMTMQGLTNKPNTNEDNTRSVVSSNSGSNSNNVDDTQHTYEDAHTRSTNDPIDVSDQTDKSNDTNTDVEDVKEDNVKPNKRTWLDKFNPFKW